jgi:hypothetical protein
VFLEKKKNDKKIFFDTLFRGEYAECSYPQEALAGTVNNL